MHIPGEAQPLALAEAFLQKRDRQGTVHRGAGQQGPCRQPWLSSFYRVTSTLYHMCSFHKPELFLHPGSGSTFISGVQVHCVRKCYGSGTFQRVSVPEARRIFPPTSMEVRTDRHLNASRSMAQGPLLSGQPLIGDDTSSMQGG